MSAIPAAFRKKTDAVGPTNPQAFDPMSAGGQMTQMAGNPMMGMMAGQMGQMGQMPGNHMMAMMGGMGGCGGQANPAMMAAMGGYGGPPNHMMAMGGCGSQPNPAMMAAMGGCGGQPNPAMMAAMGGYGGQPNPAMMAAMGGCGGPNPMMAMGGCSGQPNPAMMAAMGGCGGETNPMMSAMGGCGGEASAMMAAMGGCGGDENPVMQAMMAQQLQFQQQLMDQDADEFDKCDVQQEQLHNFVKGKGKSKHKGLDVPERLKADPEKCKMLEDFMTENPFEAYHKNRLMAAMAKRMEDGDTWMEDFETLQMAMGGAKNKCALLVGIVKSMEDGAFKPREESVRTQFRRSREIKQEAVEANSLLKKGGSIREKFEASQRKATAQLEVHRESPERSRSRGRRSRSRSRSHNHRRSPSRGRGRSRSRDRRR